MHRHQIIWTYSFVNTVERTDDANVNGFSSEVFWRSRHLIGFQDLTRGIIEQNTTTRTGNLIGSIFYDNITVRVQHVTTEEMVT